MNKLTVLLKDMTFNSRYRILDYAKDKNEMLEVATKRGIKLPASDLSIFKCTYAYVNRSNLNGCTLPIEEVEKALETLNSKAIDFDHIRERVVGHWIDAKLEGDEIVAYGVFYKGNFGEDYDIIKELLAKNVLAVSFEARGNRIGNKEGGYDLIDIEFAGGALLIKTKPALPGSEVLELSKKKRNERVLEMASIMKEPEEYIHISQKNKGKSQDKPEKGKKKETYKGGKESMKFEELQEKFDALEKEYSTLKEEVKKKDEVISKKDTVLEESNSKLEQAKATIEELKKESEEVKSKIEEVEKAKAEEISKAKKDAKVVAERRSELDEFAKDLSDENLLNDDKYEIAKGKKELFEKESEIEELKKGKNDDEFNKGSRKKGKDDPLEKSRKKVEKYTNW